VRSGRGLDSLSSWLMNPPSPIRHAHIACMRWGGVRGGHVWQSGTTPGPLGGQSTVRVRLGPLRRAGAGARREASEQGEKRVSGQDDKDGCVEKILMYYYDDIVIFFLFFQYVLVSFCLLLSVVVCWPPRVAREPPHVCLIHFLQQPTLFSHNKLTALQGNSACKRADFISRALLWRPFSGAAPATRIPDSRANLLACRP
jgi:hypothetical protein